MNAILMRSLAYLNRSSNSNTDGNNDRGEYDCESEFMLNS